MCSISSISTRACQLPGTDLCRYSLLLISLHTAWQRRKSVCRGAERPGSAAGHGKPPLLARGGTGDRVGAGCHVCAGSEQRQHWQLQPLRPQEGLRCACQY